MTDATLDSIRRHTGTALGIARGYCRKLPRTIPREDIEQAAMIGLWEWKRSHPDEETPGWIFGLKTRIRGSIIDELRHQAPFSRYAHKAADLRVYGFDDVSAGMEDTLAADTVDPSDRIDAQRLVADALCAPMPERTAKVVHLHYYRHKKFKDIGAELGVSEPRVSQLHANAIERMRSKLERDERRLPVESTLPEEGVDLKRELQRYQDWMVQQALVRSGGNKAAAARLLGIERTTLVEMLKRNSPLRPLAKCGPKEPPP